LQDARLTDFRDELDAILSSELFTRSPNLANLLRYICEKHLSGQAHEIREYNIAVDVFGRTADFDSAKDSIVRVEAHRLRKRLAQYYGKEGFQHRFRIVVPPGSYTPQILEQAGSLPRAAAPEAEDGSRRIYVWCGAALLVVGALAFAFWMARSSKPARAPVPEPARAAAPAGATSLPVRILAGLTAGQTLDSYGNTWSADRWFSGGEAQPATPGRLAYARDATMFRFRRRGSFKYDIPLPEGFYELHLYFAETYFGEENDSGGGETSRLFDVRINGETALRNFDVISDAGGSNTADIKVFRNIRPASDGLLHLEFAAVRDLPFVNAIEILPSRQRGMLPVRVLASEQGYIDAGGRLWSADRYYRGGRLGKRAEAITGSGDAGIHQSERFGNFSYAIPVARDGRYNVSLSFCEQRFGPGRPGGGGAGSRVFDVSLNGRTLLGEFDMFKESGSLHGITKTFRGVRPNAQGKLIFSFVPVINYAILNAIEVVEAPGN
jgi:hypothetical protein